MKVQILLCELVILFFFTAEVKRMARRVAAGQLALGSAYPASECTSESEAESIKEAFQHVTVRVQKSQDQQSYGWQAGDNVESWDLGSEDRSESEESDLESAFRSSGGNVEYQQFLLFWSLSISQQISASVILLQ